MNKKPTIFEFINFSFEPEKKRIVFNYRQLFDNAEPIDFAEELILPKAPEMSGLDPDLMNKILQCVHIILGISYYKFYCATKVKINYALSKKEADFWNTVYKNGLGEFFYRNNLNPKISPRFPFDKNVKSKPQRVEKNSRCMVSVSGGKDSIVAAELLKQQGFNITAIYTEPQRESEIVNEIMDLLGVASMKFRRILSSQVNQKHKYDGHVPVSAMFAFLGILYGFLYRYSYCIMANEYSSNFGNVEYKGITVNHQWSKSSEFEILFSEYVENYITPDIKYFSLLRPFYEIRIVKMFSEYKKYFPYFSSCNKNFTILKTDNRKSLWCGECPKCIFAFILFSAFLPKKEMLNIFKKNLYADEKLLPLFKDILGMGKMKPFDCVGTFEESKTAFIMGAKKFSKDFIVRQLLSKLKIKKGTEQDVFSAKQALNIPSQFRFSGMKNVLILGYGKEGKVSKKYLKNNYPNLKIGIADATQGKDYLKKQYEFDIAVKTPGIKKNVLQIPYTTATNIFFSQNKNLKIGITGSKGKSTTASLIYSILKEAGKDVELLGNIGSPMLKALENPIPPDRIFVLELSSYQLEDLDISPDIAVITNLFPEHMDHHGGLEKYYNAKKNIIRFQDKNGVFVYNNKNKILSDWAKNYTGRFIQHDNNIVLNPEEILLKGEHNLENIRLAVSVALELGISQEIILTAIKKFTPLPHRLEYVGEFMGIKFYDDAISTTPESTIMAIKTLKNIDTIFLGGQDRGYEFSQLEKEINKYKLKNIVLFPDTGIKIIKNKNGFKILKTKSMEDAVKFAFKNTAVGKICLLSCASPSYNLWKNFEEKGDQFKMFVKKYGE